LQLLFRLLYRFFRVLNQNFSSIGPTFHNGASGKVLLAAIGELLI
jgi:hypothetical protein